MIYFASSGTQKTLNQSIYNIIKTTSAYDGNSVGDGLTLHGKQT